MISGFRPLRFGSPRFRHLLLRICCAMQVQFGVGHLLRFDRLKYLVSCVSYWHSQ
jgi:hypothetical protein